MRSRGGAVARDMMSVHVGMLFKIQNSLYYTLSIFRQNWLSYCRYTAVHHVCMYVCMYVNLVHVVHTCSSLVKIDAA